jgi:hypothetical protein
MKHETWIGIFFKNGTIQGTYKYVPRFVEAECDFLTTLVTCDYLLVLFQVDCWNFEGIGAPCFTWRYLSIVFRRIHFNRKIFLEILNRDVVDSDCCWEQQLTYDSNVFDCAQSSN